MKDLIMLDRATNERENSGVIIRKRLIGTTPVWLTYAATDHMWWIIWDDGGLRKMGFIEARREACWETFFHLTDKDLARLRSS